MKICENCGMEYGDDNAFCPFCDERYGVVILADDVISADGLPPYKEEFTVIGETGVKQESFAAKRDKIYKRNIRLAARENLLPKMEVRAAYKPVVPLAEIGKGGAISPYKPPNPIVEKFNNILKKIKTIKLSKTGRAVLGVLSVAAVFFAVIGFSWFETTDTYADYQQAKRDKEYEKFNTEQQAEHIKTVMRNYDCCIYGKNNAVMYLASCYSNNYDFAYTNETDTDLSPADFSELFSGAEGMENFESILIYYTFNAGGQTEIYDGTFDFENDDKKEHLIKSGEAVWGHLEEKENTEKTENTVYVPEEITITSESGLELKLTNCREQITNKIYKYDFEFKNTSNSDIDSFCNEFIGAEYADRFYYLIAIDYATNETLFAEYWSDGIPQLNRVYTVKPGETVSGEIWLDFSDKD